MASADRWRCVYRGRPDPISASGVAQPSWHTFDRRLWQRDEYLIELTNLQMRTPGKIATYQVVLRRGTKVLRTERGHDWQGLVRQVKASV